MDEWLSKFEITLEDFKKLSDENSNLDELRQTVLTMVLDAVRKQETLALQAWAKVADLTPEGLLEVVRPVTEMSASMADNHPGIQLRTRAVPW